MPSSSGSESAKTVVKATANRNTAVRIIRALDDQKTLADYSEYIKNNVADEIRTAFEQTEGAMENKGIVDIYENAMKQVALAV